MDLGPGAPVANGVADMERSPAMNLNPEPRKIGGVPLAGIPAVLRLNTNDQIDGTGLQKGKSGSQTNPWAVLLRMGGESARPMPPPRRPGHIFVSIGMAKGGRMFDAPNVHYLFSFNPAS